MLSGYANDMLAINHGRYGKVVRVAPGIVSVSDKDMVKKILVEADYPKTMIQQGFEINEQHNLFSARDKSFHKNRRRLVAPAFGMQYLRAQERLMHKSIYILIQTIDGILEDPSSVKGKKVLPLGYINISSFMMRLTLDIIGETAFGQSFEMVKNDAHPVPGQMAKTIRRCMQQSLNPWMKWLLPLDYSFLDFAAECVRDRKSKGEQGRRADLLQYFIDAQAKERENGNGETGNDYEDMISGKLTDKAVETEACVFLIVGSETGSLAMTATIKFLVQNPEKLIKLREELDLATATNGNGILPTYDQIRKLPYLTACINEALRLRPIASSGLAREVTEDVDMNGHFFSRGTVLLAQLPLLQTDEEFFPQPYEYIPERWIPTQSPFPPVQDSTFYPFSAGTRNCIGKNYAMMQMQLVLASIVLTYDLEMISKKRSKYFAFLNAAADKNVIRMRRRQPISPISKHFQNITEWFATAPGVYHYDLVHINNIYGSVESCAIEPIPDPTSATAHPASAQLFRVQFKDLQWAIEQILLYDKDECLGGAVIQSSLPPPSATSQ
ncbi:hypothetical protein BGX28_002876 [Mortierella sp. GBA30]|nr:hypothetical protein BGX28_002876 [Mortierella sp. GBA30]